MAGERKNQTTPYTLDFEVSLAELSSRERLASDLLVSAACDIAPIYTRQENNAYPGANLYPIDATKEEIEQAAQENSNIFSPYTVVKRDNAKNLIAVPYHSEYTKLLKSPAKKLRQAAEVTGNKAFSGYLSLRADSLEDGDYEKSERAWLSLPNEPVLDIVIGPYDRYIDQLFSKKYAYQSWTGAIDQQKTDQAQAYVDSIVKVCVWDGAPIRARVDKTRVFAGLAVAAGPWSANSLPCQKEWREKYGSKITIFDPSFTKNVQKRTPALNQIWPESAEKTPEEIEKISRIFLFGHESFHPIIRREGDEDRLRSHYSTISELYCDIEGIHTARKLVGKEITEEEWSILFPHLVAIGTTRFRQSKGPSASSPYLTGEAIALNFIMEHGSLMVQNQRIIIPSNDRLADGLGEMVTRLEYLMARGTEKEAGEFIEQFGKVETFQLLEQ